MCSLPKGNKLQPWERWLKEPFCWERGWWKDSLWSFQSEMIQTIIAGEGARYRGQRCRVWSQVTPVGHGLRRDGSSVAWELVRQSTEESRAVWNGPKALFFFHFSALLLFASDECSCQILLAFWLVGKNWEKLLLSAALFQRALLLKVQQSLEWRFRPWELFLYSPPKLWKLLRRSPAVLSCGFLRAVKDSHLGR